MNTLLRDKKKGGNPMRKLPPHECKRSSIKSLINVIRIIQLTLGHVESFSLREANEEPRACQLT